MIIYLFIYIYVKNIQTISSIYYDDDETYSSHYLIAALSYFLILHPNSRLATTMFNHK